MAETTNKKRSPLFPPITDPHEWIWFDWEHGIIIRHLENSVANSSEFTMPDEFKIENGCVVRRLDSGEIVDTPLSLGCFTVAPKLVYIDFFGDRRMDCNCEFHFGSFAVGFDSKKQAGFLCRLRRLIPDLALSGNTCQRRCP